jgi:hypothetical protein
MWTRAVAIWRMRPGLPSVRAFALCGSARTEWQFRLCTQAARLRLYFSFSYQAKVRRGAFRGDATSNAGVKLLTQITAPYDSFAVHQLMQRQTQPNFDITRCRAQDMSRCSVFQHCA